MASLLQQASGELDGSYAQSQSMRLTLIPFQHHRVWKDSCSRRGSIVLSVEVQASLKRRSISTLGSKVLSSQKPLEPTQSTFLDTALVFSALPIAHRDLTATALSDDG
jgi:hypothetical protein